METSTENSYGGGFGIVPQPSVISET